MKLEDASKLSRFCSRASFRPGESGVSYSLPTGKEIRAMEDALAPRLDAMITSPTIRASLVENDPRGFGAHREKWIRQYIAYTRDGRRFVFGNFLPEQFARAEPIPGKSNRHVDPQTVPLDLCDGGPENWSAEFDPVSGDVKSLSFGQGWGASWPTDEQLRRQQQKHDR